MERRDFLRIGGIASIGAIGGGFPLLGAFARASNEDHGEDPREEAFQWAMIIDIRKCMNNEQLLRQCADACHREHSVPQIQDTEEEVKWLWDEKYEKAFPDQVREGPGALKGKPVLVLCNHCDNPPCVKVCPTRATLKRQSDGIVTQDMHRCIGCRYCMAACPYGARSFNWRDPDPSDYIEGSDRKKFPARDKGVVEKCNFCAKRIRNGDEPACVVAAREVAKVPEGERAPLTFGKLDDPDIQRILEEEHTICRRPGLGTGPNVYYIV